MKAEKFILPPIGAAFFIVLVFHLMTKTYGSLSLIQTYEMRILACLRLQFNNKTPLSQLTVAAILYNNRDLGFRCAFPLTHLIICPTATRAKGATFCTYKPPVSQGIISWFDNYMQSFYIKYKCIRIQISFHNTKNTINRHAISSKLLASIPNVIYECIPPTVYPVWHTLSNTTHNRRNVYKYCPQWALAQISI